jgi:predicted esterase
VGVKDDEPGILQSIRQLEQVVQELEDSGIPKSRIVLGGFSQGGAIALQTVCRSREKFAACVILSGWLTLTKDSQVSAEAKHTPLFWGHGEYDDKVL